MQRKVEGTLELNGRREMRMHQVAILDVVAGAVFLFLSVIAILECVENRSLLEQTENAYGERVSLKSPDLTLGSHFHCQFGVALPMESDF